MDIRFTSKAMEKISLNEILMLEHVKSRGVSDPAAAVYQIRLALTQLSAAPTLYEIPPMFRPHQLADNYHCHYGLDITRSHRLLLKPDHENEPDFNWENMRRISKVNIVEICKDYHRRKGN